MVAQVPGLHFSGLFQICLFEKKINLNSAPPPITLNSVRSYVTLCTATCVHFFVQQHNNLNAIIQQFYASPSVRRFLCNPPYNKSLYNNTTICIQHSVQPSAQQFELSTTLVVSIVHFSPVLVKRINNCCSGKNFQISECKSECHTCL